ncbi:MULTISPECIES: ABC transporter ATP-binding protein [unclassified Ruegeria]|uniref:ABC transporter ATP-binding protein n=1 Tax=unclassified Ruegeria TaxID=2625375 RepID=UPI001489CC8D|nr:MULTISPECIES: ABC transporter ATP-binding protein [unclassified Ruegeria]NOD36487.1 ATP-binding cassette domain-containing protein [Ruegeria sp. HKCCD7296]NOD49733.1 ATP-binding cassette domain-containing protein [Ruegeria sp. HKCCD5849]NOD53913.1 ATP-binding cassette domain-containing protein [Ruegeria sp. HKCCD5851]NOD68858.1 ATP-binding cassette domain-containing protein [Ruegeria sp. HKCCD7303]NOE34590.1 ATP-binding cassette domain-containing protein [Ruegeria sp. HKCCD7318]
MTALTLTNVNKSFGNVEVLKDINIEVEDGEFVVFVGPSGCGKSTLLRVIAGLEDVTSGEVRIGGELMNLTPPSKRGIAMVFQSYALYPHLNVRKNMSLALKQEGQTKQVIDERVAKASKMLNLEPYIDRYPSELSGGQRQRVAIGRAIVREPKLFLFDEPLSNLDAALRMNTRLEIANLHQQLDASMIYVTHDQTEAMTLADKIVVLRDGRVEQVGSPMELYNNPANQFVAGFLGAPSMNFFPASVVGDSADITMGVRPEDLFLADDGPLAAKVTHVEHLGGDTNVIAMMQGHQVTARLFGQHHVDTGQEIQIGYTPDRSYRFDTHGARLA